MVQHIQLAPRLSFDAAKSLDELAPSEFFGSAVAKRSPGVTARAASDIPLMPTNVVIAPAAVFAEADGSGAVVTRLCLGTQVRIVETKDGWTLIARAGKAIGYVEPKALAGLQLGSGIAWRRKKVTTRARGKGRARRRCG